MRVCLVILLTCALAGTAAACPGCRDALASQGNPNGSPWDGFQGDTGKAFSYSVLFMLGTFLTMLFGFGGVFWWKFRSGTVTTADATSSITSVSSPVVEPGLS